MKLLKLCLEYCRLFPDCYFHAIQFKIQREIPLKINVIL